MGGRKDASNGLCKRSLTLFYSLLIPITLLLRTPCLTPSVEVTICPGSTSPPTSDCTTTTGALNGGIPAKPVPGSSWSILRESTGWGGRKPCAPMTGIGFSRSVDGLGRLLGQNETDGRVRLGLGDAETSVNKQFSMQSLVYSFQLGKSENGTTKSSQRRG